MACKESARRGSVMGLGDAMYEEMVYGDGQLLNGDSFQYRLPLLRPPATLHVHHGGEPRWPLGLWALRACPRPP